MAKYISNRQQNLKIGIVSYTEDKTVLEVTGKVGIGTTNATSKLDVVGDVRISSNVTAQNYYGSGAYLTGISTFANANILSGIFTDLYVSGISTLGITSATNLTAQQLNVSGVSTLAGKIVSGNGIGNTNISNTLNYSSSSGITAFRPISLVDSAAGIKISRNAGQTNGAALELQTWDVGIVTNYSYWDVNAENGYFGIRDRKNSRSRIFIDDSGSILLGANSATFSNNYAELVGVGTDKVLNVLGNSYISGSVGIGTTNATSKLTVQGDVNVSGIVTASSFSGPITGNVTGNAATATKLATARTIGGVSFDGSANINLPGVNTAGNQNTSGSAATLTTGRTIAITGDLTYTSGLFNGSENVIGTGTLATVNSNVGTFGSSTAIPSITVNAKGLVTGVTTNAITVGDGTLTLNVSGTGLSGSQTFSANQSGNATFTVTSNATSNNTNSTIVARDGSGNFNAGIITATSFSGNVTGNINSSGVSTFVSLRSTNINASGVTTSTGGFVGALTGNATGLSGTPNITVGNITSGNINSSGIITATSGFVGALTGNVTGTATTATNLANAANITTGTINSARLSGSYSINVTGNVTGNVVGNINSSGVSTFSNGPVLVGSATSTGTASQPLQVTGGAYFSSSVGIGTINPSAILDIRGNPWFSPNTTGVKATALRLGRFSDSATAAYDILTNDAVGDDIEIQSNRYAGSLKFSRSSPSGIQTVFTLASNYTSGTSISIADTTGTVTKIQLNEAGNTYFNNSGSVLVGSIFPTGTASQKLQVTGGAYVSGNLGVGVTNPQGTIDIRSSPQWSGFNYGANLVIGGTRNNGLGILDSTNSNPWAIANNAGNLIFAQMPALGDTTTPASEAARITTNRNLVVGSITETGTASQRLQVTGGAYVSGSVGIGTTRPTTALSVVGVVSATSGFNLGISSSGTSIISGPVTRLNFIGAGNTFAVNGSVVDVSISGGSAVSIGTIAPSSPSAGNLWYNSNLGRTFIYYNDGDSSQWVDAAPFNIGIIDTINVSGNGYILGNLGIGTTNPTSSLHVVGNTLVTGVVTATTFVGALTGTATSTSNIPNLTGDITSINKATTLATVNSNVGTFGSGGAIPSITVNAKGLITGVTTTAVTSGTTITNDTSTNATRYLTFTSATSGSISAANVSSTKLTFNPSSGNLGIGTTNPTSKLDVVGDARITGVITCTDVNSTSDISLKTNIKIIEDPLEKVMQINGVSFDWKENQKPSIGVIAQELEKVLPELVTQGDVKSVNYNGLIGVLIEAIKEQQKQIDELKKH